MCVGKYIRDSTNWSEAYWLPCQSLIIMGSGIINLSEMYKDNSHTRHFIPFPLQGHSRVSPAGMLVGVTAKGTAQKQSSTTQYKNSAKRGYEFWCRIPNQPLTTGHNIIHSTCQENKMELIPIWSFQIYYPWSVSWQGSFWNPAWERERLFITISGDWIQAHRLKRCFNSQTELKDRIEGRKAAGMNLNTFLHRDGAGVTGGN